VVVVLAVVVMVAAAAARHLRGLRTLSAAARPEAAVRRRHRLYRVLDLADLGLAAVGQGVHVALAGLLGPPSHRAGLRGEADGCGLLWPLGAAVAAACCRVVSVPVRPGVRLVARFCLLAQGQQLLHRLGARRS
jgi:hypothetical protein